jgi:urea transport system ATP-binding protein
MSVAAVTEAPADVTSTGPHPDNAKNLVYLEEVKVIFDGFKALDIGYFGVRENELRVVIGPNGAGKTTLCDVISGKTKVTQGRVYFGDERISHRSEDEISQMGVGRKFQTPTVFDSLTIFENMELALPGRRRVFSNMFGKTKPADRDKIMDTLKRVGLADLADLRSKHLSHGQRQWLEISMLIVQSPRLLLVDEPAAGLTDNETHLTGELLLELAGSHTLIVIEHDMEFVRQLGQMVTVLCEGKVLCEGPLAKVQADERVIEAYLGR